MGLWRRGRGRERAGGTRIFGPSGKYSSRDLAAHTSLKPRHDPLCPKENGDKVAAVVTMEEVARRSTTSSPFRDLSPAPPPPCPLCRCRRPLPQTPPPHWRDAFAASCHSWRPPRRPLTHHAQDPMAARVLVPMAIGLFPSPPWPASPWRLLLC
ncbi:hypothetical protein ZWY2020_009319 [Hordeum vulgare]|nr:hypothetical protein ZWY2020_009319 [Hordeum vulgare]